jgi:hypothetical protein
MQKVVGSSPIIRSQEPAGNGGFLLSTRQPPDDGLLDYWGSKALSREVGDDEVPHTFGFGVNEARASVPQKIRDRLPRQDTALALGARDHETVEPIYMRQAEIVA